jgi:hypothetical protein
LRDASISTTVLKGAALADLYYRDRGARPMADMDVLVSPEQWDDAGEVLRKLDWDSTSPRFRGIPRFRSAWEFKHRDGSCIDLHWHVIEYLVPSPHEPTPGAGLLHVIRTTIAGVPTQVLDHPDQLLHVCLHGARSFPTGNVIWVADALKVIAEVPALDWERLVRLAARCRCTRAIGEALAYLSEGFPAPVPPAVVASLRSARVSRREALGFRWTSGPGRGPRLVRRAARGAGHYLRLTAGWNIGETVRGLPRYLQEIDNLDRLRGIPLATLRRVFRP